MPVNTEPILIKEKGLSEQVVALMSLERWQCWLLVTLNIFFLLAGQSAAVLLGRSYYDRGGNSKWMATLVQTAGFPLLFIPLFLLPFFGGSSNIATPPSIITLSLVYLFLGILIAGNNMLYSVGLLYLSASTYSLVCTTQLAFNAIFSFFINKQNFTSLILNSVVVLSLSASLIAINNESSEPAGISKLKYVVGFACTILASAVYSLLLSLMQLSFEKVLRKETFSVVLEMQIYTSVVASIASIIGVFVSGEWRTLHGEMMGFRTGSVSYVMNLVWTAVAWQVCSVGVVGSIFLVSSLFSNVISTVSLALVPIVSIVVFHDKMNGEKIIAMLLAFWGFATYIYQKYLDDCKARTITNVNDTH